MVKVEKVGCGRCNSSCVCFSNAVQQCPEIIESCHVSVDFKAIFFLLVSRNARALKEKVALGNVVQCKACEFLCFIIIHTPKGKVVSQWNGVLWTTTKMEEGVKDDHYLLLVSNCVFFHESVDEVQCS